MANPPILQKPSSDPARPAEATALASVQSALSPERRRHTRRVGLRALFQQGDVAPEYVSRLVAWSELAAETNAIPANTLRALEADTAVWRAWCAESRARVLPAHPRAVKEFVLAMGRAGRKPSTVARYVASLARLHRAAGAPNPTREEEVRLALRGHARTYALAGGERRQARPITQAGVDRIQAAVSPERLIDTRDLAMLLVARDILARESDLVALRVAHIEPAPAGAGRVRIGRSKTDQEGEGSMHSLSPEAMQALRTWLGRSGITTGPVFRRVTKEGRIGARALHPLAVGLIFRRLLRQAGLDPTGISGHSARVGMTHDLTAAGFPLSAIMQAGRWTTEKMPARYAEHLSADRDAVAQYHARRRHPVPLSDTGNSN